MKKSKDSKDKKDSFHAKLAFFLSLGFWIPLFNIGLCIISLVLSIKALRLYLKNPGRYGGLGFAIAAFVISVASIITTIVVFILYLSSEQICGSSVCQAYLTNQTGLLF